MIDPKFLLAVAENPVLHLHCAQARRIGIHKNGGKHGVGHRRVQCRCKGSCIARGERQLFVRFPPTALAG